MRRYRVLSAVRLPQQHPQSSNVLRSWSPQHLLKLPGMVVPRAGVVKPGNLCRPLTRAPRRSVDLRGGREIRMKSRVFMLAAALAPFSLGCTSDETAICERMDECNITFPIVGVTAHDNCEDWADDIEDTEDCLECVEEQECSLQVRCLPACET